MPYNLSIPGQISIFQMKAIEAVAALVPRGGSVVEIGSLFGSSSWAWAKSVDPSVTVYCVDPWENNAGVKPLEQRLGIKYGLEQFKAYTADCPNIVPRQGYSPRDFADWDIPVDLYYEDAVHTDPILSSNLEFWSSRLTPAGIICGDDYRGRFPDVRAGAERLAQRFGRELITVDFFWCLLPDERELPGSADVARTLKSLSRQSSEANLARGPQITLAFDKQIGTIDTEAGPLLKGRLTNQSVNPWPIIEGSPLWLTLEVKRTPGVGPVLEISRTLGFSQVVSDTPQDVALGLPAGMLLPGQYLATFTVHQHHTPGFAGLSLQVATQKFEVVSSPPG